MCLEAFVCEEGQFKCMEQKICIPGAFVCDSENDCDDGSDERNCGECGTGSCTVPWFLYCALLLLVLLLPLPLTLFVIVIVIVIVIVTYFLISCIFFSFS